MPPRRQSTVEMIKYILRRLQFTAIYSLVEKLMDLDVQIYLLMIMTSSLKNVPLIHVHIGLIWEHIIHVLSRVMIKVQTRHGAPVQTEQRECTNGDLWESDSEVSCDESDPNTRPCEDIYWCPTWADWGEWDSCAETLCPADATADTTAPGTRQRSRTCSEKSDGVNWPLDTENCPKSD